MRNRASNILTPLRLRRKSSAPDSGEALFAGLRLRLTFWYCGVLGAALILFGVTLYISTRHFLIEPVQSLAANHAKMHSDQWKRSPDPNPAYVCKPDADNNMPGPAQWGPVYEYIACFTTSGSLMINEKTSSLPAAFLDSTIVLNALSSSEGEANDTVTANNSIGSIYRCALVVYDSQTHAPKGVILIGESIQTQETALAVLLTLLLSIGSLALLGAGLGGLLLANRAMAPARLAWSNQQRFIADAAHELRTPLTLLRADAEVLLRGRQRLAEEDAMLLEDIVAETHHMGTLTTNLLTLARLDNRLAHQEHEVIHFTQLVHEQVRRISSLASQHEIMISEQPGSDVYVIGDPLLLAQAILILLDNAIKYNREKGQISVSTSVQNRQAILEVQDTGIGIAKEHLPNLGERFYRVDKARSRAAGGTGLGLSIAQSITTAHHGKLLISSLPLQGTLVSMILPEVQLTSSAE